MSVIRKWLYLWIFIKNKLSKSDYKKKNHEFLNKLNDLYWIYVRCGFRAFSRVGHMVQKEYKWVDEKYEK